MKGVRKREKGDYLLNFDIKDFSIEKFIDRLLSFELMLFLFLGSSFLLFASDSFLKKIYLYQIIIKFNSLIGIIFFLSIIIILTKIILFIYKKIEKSYSEKRATKNLEKMLEELSKKEKNILKLIFESEDNLNYLSLHSGIVKKLETEGIIGKTTSTHTVSMWDPSWPYALQPWVYKYLEKHPEYFD